MAFAGVAKKLRKQGTVTFTFTGLRLDGVNDASVEMKHAGHGNPGFENARKKIDAGRRGRAGSLGSIEWMEALIEPFAKFVIVGWNHVVDEAGKSSPPTADLIAELLREIMKEAPDYVSQMMLFAMEPSNFREIVQANAEELGNG